MRNRFNLINEPWIPIANAGLASLGDVFSDASLIALGGTPVQQIAVTKLLLAIAQAAATPENDADWRSLHPPALIESCHTYLAQWHERFYLFGEQPFLQFPAIRVAEKQSYGAVVPEIATGNTTVLTQSQAERPLNDADKALLLVCLMGFALGGKKTDNTVTLTPGYQGKVNATGRPSTGKPGSAVGYMGQLHSFWLGDTLQDTLHLNLLTRQDVEQYGIFPHGVGTPPWELMPTGEDDEIARVLRATLIGRLVPLGRFCLLTEEGIHYSEGIAHPTYKEGMTDPTTSIDRSGKEPRTLWVNPEKRPWRELTAMLGFVGSNSARSMETLQIRAALSRISRHYSRFALWSGGLRVSSNAGEQYASGADDYVQSAVWFSAEIVGQSFFAYFSREMRALDDVARRLYGCVARYFRELSDIDKSGKGKAQPFVAARSAQATHLFWQLCERDVQRLVNACVADDPEAALAGMRRRFAGYAATAFDQTCPNDTARQLDAWAQSRPNLSAYLSQKEAA